MNVIRRTLRYLQEVFWPIYGRENLKFISLLLMMSCSLFCYTIVRILKDTFILSAPLSSANTISFLKAYLVLPGSVIYMMFFYYLTRKVSKDKVFFISVLPLILFFSVFYLILLPNINYFHLSEATVLYYQQQYPALKNAVPVIGYWSYSLYYLFAELVGTVVITFLFWSFATYAVTSEEAKRFYPLLASYSHITFMLAASMQSRIFDSANVHLASFYLIIGSLIAFLAIYCFLLYYVLDAVNDKTFFTSFKAKPKDSKTLSESFKTILGSKYLLSITLVIICYGLCTNLVEVTWKELIRTEFNGDHNAIGQYFSNFYFMTGIMTIAIGSLNRVLLKPLGWTWTTALPPIFLFGSSFIFFSLVVFGAYIPAWLLGGYGAHYLAMQIGFYQDNIAKGSRYGILDPNIQMVYIPLDDELKTNGKASVDIVGSRVGKGLGSFVESSLSMLKNGADQIGLAPICMPLVLISCGAWVWAVFFLGSAYASMAPTAENTNKE